MSLLAFILYYSGYIGLVLAHTINTVLVDRVALGLILCGCVLHAYIWKIRIEQIGSQVKSISAALNLLEKQRAHMSIFAQLLPNLFSETFANRNNAEKLEYKFIHRNNKSITSALKIFYEDYWGFFVVSLCAAMPLWIFGTGEFHYKRYYDAHPGVHWFLTTTMVSVLVFIFSVKLTGFFLFHMLRMPNVKPS